MKGFLIVFEGINGSGKSFMANKLYNILPNTVYFKFPNRFSITGNQIDKFLKKEIELSLEDSIQLFIDNIIESNNEIKSKLNRGINVICDRYIISTITYNYTEIIQNLYNLNLLQLIDKIKNKNILIPDIVFLINGDHIEKRNEKEQRYHKNNTFNDLVFNNYITILSLLETNWNLINNFDINNTEVNINNIFNKINLLNNKSILKYY